jgi:glucose uptake protein
VDKGGLKGIFISVLAGCILGFVIRLMMNAISFNFHNPEIGKMTPYTASVIFAVGAFTSNFFGNYYLMKMPLVGHKIKLRDYFFSAKKLDHFYGFLAGVVWSIGWIFNMVSAGVAGFAISDALGQGATMVAALWGVLFWKEFKGADRKTLTILISMFVFYLFGLFLVVFSRYH